MNRNSLSTLGRRAKRLGHSALLLCLAGSGFALTSCTTEEGVVAGALAGAALGGVIGHSSERSYKRTRNYRNYNDRYDRYDGGRRYDDRSYYRGSRSYYPQQRYSSYSGGYGGGYSGYSDPYCY